MLCRRLMKTAAEAVKLGPARGCLACGLADDGMLLQMCLEMVMAVALRNRDRLLPVWPHVHEFLAAILAPSQVKQYLCMVVMTMTPYEESDACCPGSDISKALQRGFCRSNREALRDCTEHA